MPKAVTAWKEALTSGGKTKLAATIADPVENPSLFEEEMVDAEKNTETITNGITTSE